MKVAALLVMLCISFGCSSSGDSGPDQLESQSPDLDQLRARADFFVVALTDGQFSDFEDAVTVPSGESKQDVFDFQQACADWDDVEVQLVENGITPQVALVTLAVRGSGQSSLTAEAQEGKWFLFASSEECLL